MHILGIETSCDETAAAVVKNGKHVLSNVIVSSLKEHSKHGGIIPEIASRRQIECINAVVDEALAKANVPLKKIGTIAVTSSPGLIGIRESTFVAIKKTLIIRKRPVKGSQYEQKGRFLKADIEFVLFQIFNIPNISGQYV